jgi:hypothetical protein
MDTKEEKKPITYSFTIRLSERVDSEISKW